MTHLGKRLGSLEFYATSDAGWSRRSDLHERLATSALALPDRTFCTSVPPSVESRSSLSAGNGCLPRYNLELAEVDEETHAKLLGPLRTAERAADQRSSASSASDPESDAVETDPAPAPPAVPAAATALPA